MDKYKSMTWLMLIVSALAWLGSVFSYGIGQGLMALIQVVSAAMWLYYSINCIINKRTRRFGIVMTCISGLLMLVYLLSFFVGVLIGIWEVLG